MTNSEIASTLQALKRESEKMRADDSESAEVVSELIEKMEQQINSPTVENERSLTDQLNHTISTFESEHPRITAIANDLMIKLAGIGI